MGAVRSFSDSWDPCDSVSPVCCLMGHRIGHEVARAQWRESWRGHFCLHTPVLFCVFSMLFCLPSSQKAGQEVGMGPSALLGLSSPPSVHVAHCLFILCSGRRSPKWENYKQYQHVGPEAPKATILRSKVIFEKGFLLHHAWAEGITRGEQVSNCKVFSPPTL